MHKIIRELSNSEKKSENKLQKFGLKVKPNMCPLIPKIVFFFFVTKPFFPNIFPILKSKKKIS